MVWCWSWSWAQPDGPNSRYDPLALRSLEQRLLIYSDEVIGAARHIYPDEHDLSRIKFLSDEAIKTSTIEGETLDGSVCSHRCDDSWVWQPISAQYNHVNTASPK